MRPRTFFLYVSPVLVAAALLLYAHADRLVHSSDLYWDDALRREIQEIVEERYVEPVDRARQKELFDDAMRAYVAGLDDYGRYFTAEERRGLDEDTSGSFAGIGVQVRPASAGGMLVTAVYRDGPAERAGIEPGDLIRRVGETPLAGRSLTEMVDLIKGPVDSTVTLWVVRGDAPPTEATVTRGLVDLDTVPAVRVFDGDPPIGYVRISQFSERTPDEVWSRLEGMIRDERVGGLVVDVRRNLGGVVSSAVRVAGLFLPPDSVVCRTRSRDRRSRYTTPEQGNPIVDLPLVVLTDASSASASEILAGALQDTGRAVLVGERSFGKFLVQTLRPVSHDGVVRVTTARYETPAGRSGQRNEARGVRGGIMPDVRVPLRSREEDDELRQAFGAQSGPSWRVLDEEDPVPQHVDRQLRAALELLRGGEAPGEAIPAQASEPG